MCTNTWNQQLYINFQSINKKDANEIIKKIIKNSVDFPTIQVGFGFCLSDAAN